MSLPLFVPKRQEIRNVLCLLLLVFAAGKGSADDGGMLDQLLDQGVRLSEKVSQRLPLPTFVTRSGDAIGHGEAEKALEKIAGPMGVSRFTKDSFVAPINIKIQSIENESGQRIGHQLDVVFVVHSPISKLRDSDAIKDLMGGKGRNAAVTSATKDEPDNPEKDSVSEPLTDIQLTQNGLSIEDDRQDIRRIRFPLLDQVIIQGVAVAERSIWSEEQANAPVIYTWQLDPRFSKPSATEEELQADETLINRWRAIEKGERGQSMLGSQYHYSGIGGYMTLSAVPGQPEATIVQCSLVLHEPVDWFAGRNQIRSKLPLVVEERVRDLRRKLKKE